MVSLEHFDSIIVGGGPAGASCAWKLVRAGQSVAVIDRAVFPREKLCAGWLTGKVLEDLDFTAEDYPHSILRMRLRSHMRGMPFSTAWSPAKGENYSISRVEFDDWLLRRSGAPIIRHAVKQISREGDLWNLDGKFTCRNLVGAGGTMCPVRKALFPAGHRRSRQVVTMEREIPYPERKDTCHLFFLPRGMVGYGWYVPKANGGVNIGIGGKASWFRRRNAKIHEHFRLFLQDLQQRRLIDAATATKLTAKGHPYYLFSWDGPVKDDGVWLIGDSAGLATTDLGEGIGPAVESAFMAADEILGGASYSRDAITRFTSGGMVEKVMRKFVGPRRPETARH